MKIRRCGRIASFLYLFWFPQLLLMRATGGGALPHKSKQMLVAGTTMGSIIVNMTPWKWEHRSGKWLKKCGGLSHENATDFHISSQRTDIYTHYWGPFSTTPFLLLVFHTVAMLFPHKLGPGNRKSSSMLKSVMVPLYDAKYSPVPVSVVYAVRHVLALIKTLDRAMKVSHRGGYYV